MKSQRIKIAYGAVALAAVVTIGLMYVGAPGETAAPADKVFSQAEIDQALKALTPKSDKSLLSKDAEAKALTAVTAPMESKN